MVILVLDGLFGFSGACRGLQVWQSGFHSGLTGFVESCIEMLGLKLCLWHGTEGARRIMALLRLRWGLW